VDRWSQWAQHRRGGRTPPPERAPAPPPPQAPAQQPAHWAPPHAPWAQPPPAQYVAVAQFQQPLWTPPVAQVRTCVIVPESKDPYAELIARLPEIAPDLNPTRVDAMGMPSGDVANWASKWTPTSFRTYGFRDLGAPTHLEQHVPSRYGDTLAKIRAG